MKTNEILTILKAQANPINLKGMSRFGIDVTHALSISIPFLRKLAKNYKNEHSLAIELWNSGVHEARLLAAFIDDPAMVTDSQLEQWVYEFDSWDICDQTCSCLFDQTSFAYKKAFKWSSKEEEYVKRAGFVMMAALSVHDKEADDKEFIKFLSVIEKKSNDERNFVKKAVNWALRQIGKRNITLYNHAKETALRIREQNSKSARWIAIDALREFQNEKVIARIKQKN